MESLSCYISSVLNCVDPPAMHDESCVFENIARYWRSTFANCGLQIVIAAKQHGHSKLNSPRAIKISIFDTVWAAESPPFIAHDSLLKTTSALT